MGDSIETDIPGDPAALGALADYLRTVLAARVEGLADETAGQRSSLAGSWLGAAADAFGGRAATLVVAGDGVAAQARAAADELEALGEALRLAQEQMGEVRVAALVGGLHVDGTVIMWPADAWQQLDLLEAIPLWELWDEVEAAAEAHRATWYAALDRAGGFVASRSSTLVGLTGDLISTAAERTLLLKAARIMAGEAEFRASEVRRLGDQIDDLSRSIERFGRPGDRALLDKLAEERITTREAEEAARHAADRPVLPRELRGGFWLLDGALAGYGVYADIQEGESTEQAVVSQGSGLLAGAGSAAIVGAAVGNVVPGPGTVVGAVAVGGAALVAGAVGSYLGDKGVDHLVYGHDDSDGEDGGEPDPGDELLDYAAEALSSPRPAGDRESP